MAEQSQRTLREKRFSNDEMKRSITKLDRAIRKIEEFDVSGIAFDDLSPFRALEAVIDGVLGDVFGYESIQYGKHAGISVITRLSFNARGGSAADRRDIYLRRIKNARSVLTTIRDGFAESLGDGEEDSTSRPLRAYESLDLHPEIERQVGQLFRDGHYAEAVEKSIKVLNNLVRLRSNESLDGTALMQKVFSSKNPILKFNDLTDKSDEDEQQGFMYLFSGAVMGLRNPRAHKIIQDDPERALEFIAFVSLLAKLLDSAKE